jgi:hypothetical protein
VKASKPPRRAARSAQREATLLTQKAARLQQLRPSDAALVERIIDALLGVIPSKPSQRQAAAAALRRPRAVRKTRSAR